MAVKETALSRPLVDRPVCPYTLYCTIQACVHSVVDVGIPPLQLNTMCISTVLASLNVSLSRVGKVEPKNTAVVEPRPSKKL